jgi:integrase/recombinase XerD
MLCAILSEYMRIRGGSEDDYLFSNDMGEQMTEYCLKNTIAKYNKRRGVQKTSIHMFRHTFAKKYLVDCGGNAFTLQRLLGHSTLEMTKHYCAIFDSDITKNYDKFSPLTNFKSKSERIKMNKI